MNEGWIRWRALLLCLLCGCVSIGCGARAKNTPPSPFSKETSPGPLRSIPADWPDFFAEQTVEIEWGTHVRSFHAVMQKRGTLLELILLGPMDQPAYRIYEDGDQTGVEQLVPKKLPFDATYILADVQKAFMPWLDVANPPAKKTDTTRKGRYKSLRWTETLHNGRPQKRSFWREDIDAEVPLRVTYDYSPRQSFPAGIVLHNPWFSYTLRIRTLRWQPL